MVRMLVGGDGWVGVAEQVHNISRALVAYSSTCDVSCAYGTGVLSSRSLFRIYVDRHM